MSEQNTKISVIIPMDTQEQSIHSCLALFLAQTLKEFEILCVGDSVDKTTKVELKEQVKNDERVRWLDRPETSRWEAMHDGFHSAVGEYVLFWDAENEPKENMLEAAYHQAKEKEAEVLLLDAVNYDPVSNTYQETSQYLRKDILPDKELFNRSDIADNRLLNLSAPVLWNKLFRRSFILDSEVELDEPQQAKETFAGYTLMAKAERITALTEPAIVRTTGLAHSDHTNPKESALFFMDEFELIHQTLMRWGVYEDVRCGLLDEMVKVAAGQLRKIRDNQIRMEILHRLKESFFYTDGALDDSGDLVCSHGDRMLVQSAMESMDWKEKQEVKHADSQIIKRGQITGKVMVSVIIPAYNAQKYLAQSITSVLEQSLKEIELICVDDGSTDQTCEIMKEFAQKDSRITVIHKENGGPSAARNVGIQNACGEYLYYLDSDDYLDTQALEILYRHCKEKDLQIVYFDGISFSQDESIRLSEEDRDRYLRKHAYGEVMPGIAFMRTADFFNEYKQTPTMQMIQKEYLDKIGVRFYEGIIHEDDLYTFSTLIRAQRVGHLPKVLYHRRYRPGSIMTQRVSFDHCYGFFVVYTKMIQYLEEMEDEIPGSTLGLHDIPYRVMSGARNSYEKIDEHEKYYFYSLDAKEYYLFLNWIYNPVNDRIRAERIKEEKETVRSKLKETNDKLQKTYAEKSEINAKLQKTYDEKAERGIQIRELQKENRSLTKKKDKLEKNLSEAKTENKKLKKEIGKLEKQKDKYYQMYKNLEKRSVICWIKKIIRKIKG